MKLIVIFFGLLVTDGNLQLSSRNRGKVTLELSIRDEDIIYKLYNHIPGSIIRKRSRTTNFTNGKLYNSIILSNHHIEFRTKLINWGFPIINKTENACPPNIKYSEIDFWRGVIDGDGSIGITSNNIPYICLGTKSEKLKNEYLSFLYKKLKIQKNITRNKRDNIYNIMSSGTTAIKIINLLYSNTPILYLNRKYQKYLDIMEYNKHHNNIIFSNNN